MYQQCQLCLKVIDSETKVASSPGQFPLGFLDHIIDLYTTQQEKAWYHFVIKPARWTYSWHTWSCAK